MSAVIPDHLVHGDDREFLRSEWKRIADKHAFAHNPEYLNEGSLDALLEFASVSKTHLHLLRETNKAQAVKRQTAELAATALLSACDAAETMLRCMPETTTNACGTKPTMTTSHALRLLRAAMAKHGGTNGQ